MRPDFLQPGEVPLHVQRRHPLSALDAWLGILVLALLFGGGPVALALALAPGLLPVAVAAAAVVVALSAAWALAVWFRVRTSLNVVTPDRVYHAQGRWRFFLSQTTYDRVTDLQVHQSFFGRRLGFGTVVVQTAGQGVRLLGVRDPLGAKRAIEQAREAMVRRLVAAHRPTARAGAGQSATASAASIAATPRATGGPPAWVGRPTLASLLTPMVALLVMVPLLLPALAGAATLGPAALILPALLLLVLGLAAASVAIRRRTTRYEVHAWGVSVASGWLGRRHVEARYEKVTDVAVLQPVLGRIFGFGTIRINTAGGTEAPVTFAGVAAPEQVKAIIDRARQGLA